MLIPRFVVVNGNPSIGLGGIPTPCTLYQFGKSNIPSSSPYVGGWPPLLFIPNTIVTPFMDGGEEAGGGSTFYIPFRKNKIT